MMGLMGWVKVERDSQPGLPEKKGPKGVIGEGREEEGGTDWSNQRSRWTQGYDGSKGVGDRRERHTSLVFSEETAQCFSTFANSK